MTRDEIMALQGRELDKAVAEHVFGARRVTGDDIPKAFRHYGVATENLVGWLNADTGLWYCQHCGNMPAFSTDIASAWQVFEHMADQIYEVHVSYHPRQMWPNYDEPVPEHERRSCFIGTFPGTDMGGFRATGRTAPEVICRAALLVVFAERENTNVRSVKNDEEAGASE